MAMIKNNDIALSIYLGSKDKTGHDLHLYLKNVVKFLIRRRLMSKVPDILLKLKKIIYNEENILEAKISSAAKLDIETKHHLVHTLKNRYKVKGVLLNEMVDGGLLGGFRIEIDDEVIDLTLKNKIRRLQAYLKAI